MYCVNCGAAVSGETLTACTSCGQAMPPMLTRAEVGRVIKEASTDALHAMRRVAVDPIAGLGSSFSALGERRARAAGIAFGVAFALLTSTAALIALSGLHLDGVLKIFFGAFFVALMPFVGIVASSAGARKLLRGTGTVAADLFTAGVALLPIGTYFVLSAVLGIQSYQAIGVLSVFAFTYFICILFAGSTGIAGIPDRFAPPVIAIMLIVATLLSKIAATTFFGSDNPLGRFFGS